jgi:alkylhydroperoxidase family enzyme
MRPAEIAHRSGLLTRVADQRLHLLHRAAPIASICIRAICSRKVCPRKNLALVPVWFEADDLFSERERAALAWAETVTHVADTHIPDDAYQAAKLVFDDKELADLTIAIGLMNAYNRLATGFRTTPLALVHSISSTV